MMVFWLVGTPTSTLETLKSQETMYSLKTFCCRSSVMICCGSRYYIGVTIFLYHGGLTAYIIYKYSKQNANPPLLRYVDFKFTVIF